MRKSLEKETNYLTVMLLAAINKDFIPYVQQSASKTDTRICDS